MRTRGYIFWYCYHWFRDCRFDTRLKRVSLGWYFKI